MRVVILRGRVSKGHFVRGSVDFFFFFLRDVVRITFIFFFSLFYIHVFLYIGLVNIFDIHCTYLLYIC